MLTEYGVPVVNGNKRFSISRKYFETFTEKHWKQWADLLMGAFDEVDEAQYNDLECPKKPEDVELLIITGGHSKWYVVPEYLLGKKGYVNLPSINFAKIRQSPLRLVQSKDPQETVAVGLCHLDEDVVGTIAASNDVAISFTCEGKYLGACDLIKKGVPLPYEKRDFLMENTIKGNFIFRRELVINYSIITDKTNTINKSIMVPSDGIISVLIKGVIGAVIGSVFIAIGAIAEIVKAIRSGDLSNVDGKFVKEIMSYAYHQANDIAIILVYDGLIRNPKSAYLLKKTVIKYI